MIRWLYLLALVALTMSGVGCSTTPTEDNVSTIPWNRPQGWEGAGQLGGFRPPGSP